MNSLFPQQQPRPPINTQQSQLLQLVKASKDPGQLFQTMAKNNPQVQSIMQMIQQTNQTPKELFYKTAQQQGIDPNQILGMFQ